MIRSIYVGITGMKAFQEGLSVTSNNIANSQTVGHKAQKATFEDLFYKEVRAATRSDGQYAGANPISLGNGVKMSGARTIHEQGSVNYTGGKTDVAIEGRGYFILGDKEGLNNQYTRKGTFQLSDEQALVTENGQYVLGWTVDPATSEVDTYNQPTPIYIKMDQAVQGKATTKATISGNVDFDMDIGNSVRTQFASYDSAGKRTSISVEYIKKSNTTFNSTFYYAAIPSEAFVPSDDITSAYLNTKAVVSDLQKGDYAINTYAPVAPATQATIELVAPDGSVVLSQMVDNVDQPVTLTDGTGRDWMTVEFNATTADSSAKLTVGDVGEVKFGANGRVEDYYPSNIGPGGKPTVDFISPTTGRPVSIEVNMDSITAFATDTSIGVESVDGGPASSIRDFSIADDGNIEAQYSDGSVRLLGKIAVATFANPDGLTRVGKGNYLSSVTSGEATVSASGEAGAGNIRAQALENSNVDLSTEFVDLMVYQKSFQANTKVIQVSDEVIGGIINLIR